LGAWSADDMLLMTMLAFVGRPTDAF
jgi:hypothetical protein